MKIEEAIQQPKFDNERHKALVNILYTHNYLINNISEELKSFDITRQQFNVLRILKGQHPKGITILLIRERMLDKLSDASRIVDRLQKKGYVNKTASKDDRRAVTVKISKKGLGLIQRLEPASSNFNEMLNQLTKKEASLLSDLLDKIRVE